MVDALPVYMQDFPIKIESAASLELSKTVKLECKLLAHAKLYSAADKVGLKKLKQLSSLKFLKTSRDAFLDPSTLEKAFNKVYVGTSSEDTNLRLTLTQICIQNAATIMKHTKIMAVMEKHELCSWRIGTSLLVKAALEKTQNTEIEKKIYKIIGKMILLLRCGCYGGQEFFQGSKSLQANYGGFSNVADSFVSFEPRRLEIWDGLLRICCSGCNVTGNVSQREII